MGLLSLFGVGEKPTPSLTNEALGSMTWTKDENGWAGSFNGLAYVLSYEKKEVPNPDMLAYAVRVLRNRDWLVQTLEQEKRSWIAKYPDNAAEIETLQFGTISFYRHKDAFHIFASLNPEVGDRAWRIEYKNDQCMGLGFDS